MRTQTSPQNNSRARQQSTTQQHSTTEHDTGKQGTTANRTNHRQADHEARHGHRHRNTPPADNQGPSDPAPHHRPPKKTAQDTAAHHSTGRQRQHAPHEKHNASASAQRSTAPHRAKRSGKAQHNTPGHTQYKAQRRTTARTSTPQQNTHSTKHTARENTAKTQRRRAHGPRATGGTRGHGTTSNGTQRAQQNNRAHNGTTPGGTTRSSAAQRCIQGHTAQHSTRQCRPKPDSKLHRKQAEHGKTAPENTGRKGSVARQHQTAQGTTHAPG